MEEADIVVAKHEDVASETTVDFLGTSVVLEVLVVGKDIDNKFGSKEEVAPVFEGANDGKELPIPDWVVPLSFSEGGGVVSDRVTQSVCIALVEDGTRGELRGVHFKFERFIMVGLS